MLNIVIYPLIAHWVWSKTGFLSNNKEVGIFGLGLIDFAGSSVVHMTGGIGKFFFFSTFLFFTFFFSFFFSFFVFFLFLLFFFFYFFFPQLGGLAGTWLFGYRNQFVSAEEMNAFPPRFQKLENGKWKINNMEASNPILAALGVFLL